MNQDLQDVYFFQHRFKHSYDGAPRDGSPDLRLFRLHFLAEELRELGDAMGFRVNTVITEKTDMTVNRVKVLDALVDLDYVLKGTVLQFGYGRGYAVAWDRVHAANMRKECGTKATRGFTHDVIKPPGWVEPDLSDLVGLPGGDNAVK